MNSNLSLRETREGRDRVAEAARSFARTAAAVVSSGDGRVLASILLCALGWRALSAFMGFFSNVVFPLAGPQQFTVTGRTHLFWDALARYDSGWYFGVAKDGYQFVEGGRSNLAFFPIYPLGMRYLGEWIGGRMADYYYAGIIISWLAFAGAMVILYRLARLDLGRDEAVRACVYASVFPFSFFFGMVYPTSLFLFLCVATFLAFRTGHWAAGALTGALATCTRVNGILIVPALALILYSHWRHDSRQLWRGALALCLVPAGLVSYSAFNYAASGSLTEFARSIQRWGYTPGDSPWTPLGMLLVNSMDLYDFLAKNPSGPYDLLNGTAAFGALCVSPFVWRRLGGAYAVFVLANLVLPLSSGQVVGLGRYTAVLFPIYLWLATLRGPMVQTALLVTFAMLHMLCLALFVNLHPLY